jgi:D-arabinose 1-dehydrogenase-like Zn-dependent alcohol dehydrogenase
MRCKPLPLNTPVRPSHSLWGVAGICGWRARCPCEGCCSDGRSYRHLHPQWCVQNATAWPFIVGRDRTGVVAQIGTAVRRFKSGERVWANNQGYDGRQGTSAEYLSVDERLLSPLPPGVEMQEAVVVLHSALTAVVCLFAKARLHAGETMFGNGGRGPTARQGKRGSCHCHCGKRGEDSLVSRTGS